MANGYWGKLIEVDMTTGKIEITDRHMQYVKDWIGGHALGIKLLWEALKDKPGIDAMGPENVFMILPGVSCGVPISGAGSRYCVYTKSPLTQAKNSPYGEFGGTVCWATGGGKFGPTLRMAGYDGIYVTGVSATPKILYIDNDIVELRDATKYWGMTVTKFEEAIQADFGIDFKNTCCGPAAEEGCRYCAVLNEAGRAAGRAGGGSVMGAKKLKGVVVRGDQVIPIADPSRLKEVMDKYENVCWSSAACDWRRRWGTASALDTNSVTGGKSVRNHREGQDPYVNEISGVASFTKYWVRHRSCYGCPWRCMKFGVVHEGPYANRIAEGPEYESAMISSNWLLNNMNDFGGAMEFVDAAGFDTMGAGGIVGFCLEAYENKVITKEMLGGLEMAWGDYAAIEKFLTNVMYNKDLEIYEWFRRGTWYTANKLDEKYGTNSKWYAMTCKNQDFAAWNVSGTKSMGIGYATVLRGACHVNGANQKAQSSNVLRDMGTFCNFSGGAYGSAGQADIINFIMGTDLTADQYIFIGEKAHTLEKCFNALNGFTREDDMLPGRIYEGTPEWGPKKGQIAYTLEDFNKALDDYYESAGWDKATSFPTDGKLQELGLNDVIPYMKKIK